MSKVEDYARALDGLDDPEPYLLEHSGLPGPRGNIELGLAAARVCDAAQLRRWAALDAQAAPTGGAGEFLAFCGVVGLGRLLAEGDASALDELRTHADDSRWRVREAVAMALQRWGADDFQGLATAMAGWAHGSWLERRAAAAALCEPVLLTDPPRVQAVLARARAGDRRGDLRRPRPASLRRVQGPSQGTRLLLERRRRGGSRGRATGLRGSGGARGAQRRPRPALDRAREPAQAPARAPRRRLGGNPPALSWTDLRC